MSLPVLQPFEAARPGSRGSPGHLSRSGNQAKLGQAAGPCKQGSFPDQSATPGMRGPVIGHHRSMPELKVQEQMEPQTACQEPNPIGFQSSSLVESVSVQSSMYEFKKRDQAQIHARNRLMAADLGNLGLMGLPSCQRMRAQNVRQRLLHARASGDLKALRSAMRAARAHLGFEDELVKQVGKLYAEAERYMCLCRDCFASESLETLPSVMSKFESIIVRVKLLELGARIWEDPYLGAARRKLAAWREHRVTLESMAEKLQERPATYCDAWAQLAVSNSDLTIEFGSVLTRGLLSLPYAAAHLVFALSNMFKEITDDPSDEMDVLVAAIMNTSKMLSQLDRGRLDDLLLRPGSESGATSLQIAADCQDLFVFIALYQTITGEVIDIQHELQQQLGSPRQWTPQQASEHIAFRLGELLQLDHNHLCLRTAPGEQLTLRLLVHAGQPRAQHSQQVLGNKAAIQPWRQLVPRIEELTKWQEVGYRVKGLYDARKLIRSTKAAAERTEVAFVAVVAELEMAKTRADEAEVEAENAAARWFMAKGEAKEFWEKYVARMKEVRDTMQRETSDDNDVAKARASEAEAEEKSTAAKKRVAEAEVEATEARAASEAAKIVVAEMEAAVELALQMSLQAYVVRVVAVSSYQAFLHTSLTRSVVDSPRKKLQSGSGVQRSPPGRLGKHAGPAPRSPGQ